MTKDFIEAEIAAAIRKFIDQNGVLYYQHAQDLARAVMLPVGHALAHVEPVAEKVVEDVKHEAETAVTAVEAVVTPIKRTPRKKKTEGTDAGSGD